MQRTGFKNVSSFIKKYKILHVIFWIWAFVGDLHVHRPNHALDNRDIFDSAVIILSEMVCVYFVVYYLMPKILYHGKYLRFTMLVFITVLCISFITIFLNSTYVFITENRFINSYQLLIMYTSRVVDTLVMSAYFFALYTIQDRYSVEQTNRQLEKERLETELNYLKAQINPHFLFNAINSIYVLIEEDKKLASQTLLKFSGLLRYQLYDCVDNHMLLSRELEFLNDYIDLEILRNGDDLNVSFNKDFEPGNGKIAPFILIPFVENAFKHRSHHDKGNYVNVSAKIMNGLFEFSVSNTYDMNTVIDHENGGIGLQNVQRRLELLYPKTHTMHMEKTNGVYNVNLKIELK